MGFAKELSQRQLAQGWDFTDGFVCAGCIDDYALKADVQSAAEGGDLCTFCGESPAAELNVLLESFMNGLFREYGDAGDEAVFYESREGGYQANPQWDTYELVDEFWDVLTGPGLLDKVRDAIHDRIWVERDYSRSRVDQALSTSWRRFCEAVQYETRYVFWLKDDPEVTYAAYTGDVPPSRILDEVGKLILHHDMNLIRQVPAGYSLIRARTHENQDEARGWDAGELGTAPRDKAKRANRMSPAGIPLFYGSEDQQTAIAEISERDGNPWVTVAAFETSAACTVVDFTELESPPSMFDARNAHRRRPLMFLHEFVEQMSKPARSDWEQLDYVPTQIVTEYLFQVFLGGDVVAGILYPSAQTGRVSAVFDIGHSECVEQSAGWREAGHLCLGLVSDSIETHRVG